MKGKKVTRSAKRKCSDCGTVAIPITRCPDGKDRCIKCASKIEEKCRRCNEPLHQMKWNEHHDIVLCDNTNCAAYHEPVRVVQRLPAVPEEVI